ncbi:hypothetical protein PMAYCL1PPCAC_17036, partial [Pristionchus mayeri]
LKLNSDVTATVCFAGALVCAICYILIFLVFRRKPQNSRKREFPMIITSFSLFLTLCILSIFLFLNRFWADINMATLYFFRKHFYLVSFPM